MKVDSIALNKFNFQNFINLEQIGMIFIEVEFFSHPIK